MFLFSYLLCYEICNLVIGMRLYSPTWNCPKCPNFFSKKCPKFYVAWSDFVLLDQKVSTIYFGILNFGFSSDIWWILTFCSYIISSAHFYQSVVYRDDLSALLVLAEQILKLLHVENSFIYYDCIGLCISYAINLISNGKWTWMIVIFANIWLFSTQVLCRECWRVKDFLLSIY